MGTRIRQDEAHYTCGNVPCSTTTYVREEKGRVVIAPVRQKSYRIEDLVKRINAKNLPEAIDFGPPAGKEVW